MVKKISVDDDLHEILKDDRDFFQQTIGGKRWTISDVLREYYKILPKKEAKILYNSRWMKWETYKKLITGESNGRKQHK